MVCLGRNLLKKNIYHTISKPFGKEVINLKPYNIVVSDSIVVSIELIKVYGNYVDFEVAASRYKGTSFTRHLSQDKWKKYDNLMAFTLNTSYPIKRDSNKDITRELPKKITLYWDTSLTLKNRKLNNEIDLIKRYFNKLKNVEVEVIKFSTNRQKPKEFLIKNGNSKDIVTYLESTLYDGATNYAKILKDNTFEAETILVFTDGNENFEALKQLVYVPAFYINSLAKSNDYKLQTEASYADGHYINLRKIDSKLALKLMLNEIEDEEEYAISTLKTKGNIYGKIISDSLIIHGATIRVKNTFREVISDIEGNFRIDAREGDVLIINAFGMLKKQVRVFSKDKIDIELKLDGEVLEAVLLLAKAKKEEKITETPYGKKSFDAITFAFDEIKKEDIKPEHHTLDQIVSKIPGVVIMGFGSDKRYFFARNLGSSMSQQATPIIVIDGMIYYQSDGLDRLPPIDIQTIESIKALKSIISTNRYGGAGAYGAIVIKTQMTSFKWVKVKEKTPSALVSGNDYVENVPIINNNQEKPSYISQLENATSYKNALAIYKRQKGQLSVPYYINVANYFKRWNKDYALTILSNIAEVAKNNPKALKTLAYKYEEKNKYEEAKFIYERIATLRPKDSQSYRDLALIYQQTGAYKKAMDIYKQMLSNSINDVDFSGLQETIINELKHFISFHGSKVDYQDLPSDLLKTNFKYDLRIVFDWNDPNAEFEVQFVNPQKKYFMWNQTKLDNKERMLEGITKGYSTEEFIIDDDDLGEWIINIEAINDEPQLNPTYLKYTVFRNYGLVNEIKEVKVVNLNTCKPKVTFDKLLNQ